jgi:hypothetical protein
MELINQIYQNKCYTPSDINEHLPVLKRYAEECDIVVEMGVRSIVSTWAFLSARPKKLISLDIVHPGEYINHDPEGCDLDLVKKLSDENGRDFTFILGDRLKGSPIVCDLLFIDTLHDYDQLKGELEIYASSCRKYIILHDTTHFAEEGETKGKAGIWGAIVEFLEKNKEWEIKERLTNNNGMTILKNKAL